MFSWHSKEQSIYDIIQILFPWNLRYAAISGQNELFAHELQGANNLIKIVIHDIWKRTNVYVKIEEKPNQTLVAGSF